MVEPGKETKVTVYGRNLPGGVLDPKAAVVDGRVLEKVTITVKPPDRREGAATPRLQRPRHADAWPGTDGFELRLKNARGTSNPYLLTYAHGSRRPRQRSERHAGNGPEVTVPCEIAGRIEKAPRPRLVSLRRQEGRDLQHRGLRRPYRLDARHVLQTERRQGSKNMQEFDDNPEILHPLQFYSRTR